MDSTLFQRTGDLPTMIFHWKAQTLLKQPGTMQMSAHQHFCHLLSLGPFLSN